MRRPKTLFIVVVIAVIAALLTVAVAYFPWSPVVGQIFVVQKNRENIKMGLVGVHVLTNEQLSVVAAPLLKSYQSATEKHSLHSAQCGRDRDRLAEFESELSNLLPPKLKISEFDRLQVEIMERREMIQSTNRGELVDPLLADEALADQFVAALPPPAQKTDADGRFNLRARQGDWLIAQASRTLLEGTKENFLWICRIPENKSPVLLSNDSLVNTAALVAFLSQRSGLAFEPREPKVPAVSSETETWIRNAQNRALDARSKAISDEFESARSNYLHTLGSAKADLLERWGGNPWRKLKDRVASVSDNTDPLVAAALYGDAAKALESIIADVNRAQEVSDELESARSKYLRTLDSVSVELLDKWGGEGWRKLKIEVASICDNKDPLAMASLYRDATTALNGIIGDVYPKEAADKQRIRMEQQREAEAERAEKQAAQERTEKAAELEKLRNTPIFSGTVSDVSAGFKSFEFGFGFWVEPTLGGVQLRIFLNGTQPKSEFSGSNADASINIVKRLKGSERYTSGGHDFLIEWDKRSKFAWSADIVVRRLN